MDPRLRTPALRGDLAAVNRALDEGADPNLADPDGYNPLIFAAVNNRVDCAARLIEAGARVDCHTNACITPLIIAAKYGDVDIAAGGFPVYARAHRSLFVGILSRGTRLPADVIPKIVDYWAHLGWYQYTQ